jgi:DNA-binding NtrC family response regulator
MHSNRETEYWSTALGTRESELPEFISRSLAMRRIGEQLPQAAGARLILLEGEAGSGKQLLARHIRALSPASGSFAVGEAANFFGRGAQTGPDSLASAVERSVQGLLLLRGIDELTTAQQAELIRFIRAFETEFSLGNTSSQQFPSQIVCTVRQSLRSSVLAGKFLPELYYRLSAVCLAVPPLRERKEDLPGLARIFIETCARERRKPLQGLGPGCLSVLLHHRWPGNVREFESVIRSACFAAEGQWLRPIDLVILPLESVQHKVGDPPLPQDLKLDGVLRRHVQRVLKACDGNKAQAALRLGISRSTLYRMLDSADDASLPLAEPDRPSEPKTNDGFDSLRDPMTVS